MGCPVSLVLGELDRKFVEIGRRMIAAAPRFGLELVRGAGYNVVLERPDAFAVSLIKRVPLAVATPFRLDH